MTLDVDRAELTPPETGKDTVQYAIAKTSLRDQLTLLSERGLESMAQHTIVETASEQIIGGTMVLSHDNSSISLTFAMAGRAALEERIRSNPEIGDNIHEGSDNNGIDFMMLPDVGIRLLFQKSSAGEDISIVTLVEEDAVGSDLPYLLSELGMSDILKRNNIPKEADRDYVQKLIDRGEIDIDGRTIPVTYIESKAKIKDTIQTQPGVVFHATSVDKALMITQIGLLSERSSKSGVHQRYILSNRPDGISADIANDQWGSHKGSHPSKFGVIIEFSGVEGVIVEDPEAVRLSQSGEEEHLSYPNEPIPDLEELTSRARNLEYPYPIDEARVLYLDPKHITNLYIIDQVSEAAS